MTILGLVEKGSQAWWFNKVPVRQPADGMSP